MLMDLSYLYAITDFDRDVFARLLPKRHPLVLALERIDWEALRRLLYPYYSPDRGQPAIDPLLMLKLEFLKYRHNLSDQQVIDRATTDLAFRYFLQVGSEFWAPDPSSLCRFRARLGPAGFKQVFDAVVAHARRAGLVKDRLRLKDASHVVASIAVPTTLTLVAQIRDRLLKAAEPFDAEWVAGQRVEVDLLRERTKDQLDEFRLSARVTHLQELVDWAKQPPSPGDLEANAATAKAWAKFQQTLALAEKILDDRQPQANRKTLSVHDPEARRGKHGEYYDGYLTDILMDADSEIITQINVLEAGGDEAWDAIELVRAEQAAHGNQIQNLSIDGVGFNGAMLRELEGPAIAGAAEVPTADSAVTDERTVDIETADTPSPGAEATDGDASRGLGVKTFVPPKSEPSNGRFTQADFVLNEDGSTVTCPAGKTSQYQQRDTGRNATIFRFTREQCDGCPLLRRCVAKPQQGAFGRSVSKNDYDPEYARTRARAKTPEFHSVRKEHPAVERKLNEVLNHHGGRRARYFGKAKVCIQQFMTATVVNVKRIVTLLGAVRAEPTTATATILA